MFCLLTFLLCIGIFSSTSSSEIRNLTFTLNSCIAQLQETNNNFKINQKKLRSEINQMIEREKMMIKVGERMMERENALVQRIRSMSAKIHAQAAKLERFLIHEQECGGRINLIQTRYEEGTALEVKERLDAYNQPWQPRNVDYLKRDTSFGTELMM